MKLIESIASYTGESYRNIKNVINEDVKKKIADIIRLPQLAFDIDKKLLNELIEMDVFSYSNGIIKPNTAIFFEEDIKKIYEPVFSIGSELANIIKANGSDLEDSSPNIRNFIGSIMGAGQGLHKIMKEMGLASNWQNKTGKYEKSKIDFNEECEAYSKFGDDLQIKRIYKGKIYTSVIIGSSNNNYISYVYSTKRSLDNEFVNSFCDNLATYLTDTFPLLITGSVNDESLKAIAQAAYIDIDDRSSVISIEDSIKYQNTISKITEACSSYFFYSNKINIIIDLLKSTIVGKQGVPIENMMMNFWRYLRRTTAIKLYENGFLTDSIPNNGTITVFYENDIKYF